jgi:hypothetical protein
MLCLCRIIAFFVLKKLFNWPKIYIDKVKLLPIFVVN